MKIAFVYRTARPGGYSIEGIFNVLRGHFRGHTIVEYSLSGRKGLLKDLLVLWAMDADVYHITGDVNYIAPFLPRGRVVITIHDIGHYSHGLRGWKRWLYGKLWFSIPLRFASAVTCVSRQTSRSLQANFHLHSTPLYVVENCISPCFQPSKKIFESASPVILQVGTKPYKNVPRLVHALKELPCRLVLVGAIDADIHGALEETGVEYETHVNVPQDTLVELYRRADLVTFVSTGEGFGLPIVEAQSAGKPLVTSNLSPLNDVAGEGACTVDPLDVSAIRAGILKLIQDEAYRERVVSGGLLNARRFSPQAIAGRYEEVYSALLGNLSNRGRTR